MAKDKVDLNEYLEKQAELNALREQYGIEKEPSKAERIGDWIVDHARKPRRISRKKYVTLALTCGWFCGAHCFYSGHKVQGVLYLLFCWTGVSLAMTIVDLLLVFLKYEPDKEGMIEL